MSDNLSADLDQISRLNRGICLRLAVAFTKYYNLLQYYSFFLKSYSIIINPVGYGIASFPFRYMN